MSRQNLSALSDEELKIVLLALLKAAELSDEECAYVMTEHFEKGLPSKLKKLLSMAFSYLAQALNTTGNTFLFKKLNLTDVGSLATAFQSCFRNVFTGALIALGKILSGALKTKSLNEVRKIVSASYVIAAIATIVSMGIYALSYPALPSVVAESTAQESSLYLLITGAGTWFTFGLTVSQQFAYAKNHYFAQFFSTLMSRIPPVGLGYLLMEYTPLPGTASIALGNLIAPAFSYGAFELWMRTRPDLKEILQLPAANPDNVIPSIVVTNPLEEQLLTQPLITSTSRFALIHNAFKEYWREMTHLFMLMGFQRASEWVNLMIITFILGGMRNYFLSVMSASLQTMSIFNLCSTGIGSGATMDVEQLKKLYDRTLKSLAAVNGLLKKSDDELLAIFTPSNNHNNIPLTTMHLPSIRERLTERRGALIAEADNLYPKLKNLIRDAQLLGFGINTVVATGLFFGRNYIAYAFSADNATAEENTQAATLLWITAISLITDASRLISASSSVPLENPFEKLNKYVSLNLLLNLISFFTMTAIGIPASILFSRGKSDDTILYSMFAIRTIMIFVAAISNLGIQALSLMNERKKLEALKDEIAPTIAANTSGFLPGPRAANDTHAGVLHNDTDHPETPRESGRFTPAQR